MPKIVVGVLAATVAVYLWGFLYWALNPLPYNSWHKAEDDAAAAAALTEHFPDVGTYFVPRFDLEPSELTRRYESGPIAFVHMTSVDGRPQVDPTMMVKGFVLQLVTCIVLAVLLWVTGMRWYVGRALVVVLAGLSAAVMVDIGDVVWWAIPLEWKIHQAAYTLTAYAVMGFVLAALVKPKPDS